MLSGVGWTRESVFECGHCTKTYATSQPVLVGCRFVFIFVQAYPVNDSWCCLQTNEPCVAATSHVVACRISKLLVDFRQIVEMLF